MLREVRLYTHHNQLACIPYLSQEVFIPRKGQAEVAYISIFMLSWTNIFKNLKSDACGYLYEGERLVHLSVHGWQFIKAAVASREVTFQHLTQEEWS